MPYAPDLYGHQPDSHLTVHVENYSLFTTPSAAPKEPCHPSDMIAFETSVHIS